MKYVYVGGLGSDVDIESLSRIRSRISEEFPAVVREIDLPDVEFAYESGRRQYKSIEVLEMLARACPQDAMKLVGVTERDLFIPVLTFVFGQAQLNGRVAVVSLARLRQEFYGLMENREVFLERVEKEALHETGHTFGLVHCADGGCAMSLATNVRQIDRKRAGFCPSCEGQLRKPPREQWT
jgi:archaemetzincin